VLFLSRRSENRTIPATSMGSFHARGIPLGHDALYQGDRLDRQPDEISLVANIMQCQRWPGNLSSSPAIVGMTRWQQSSRTSWKEKVAGVVTGRISGHHALMHMQIQAFTEHTLERTNPLRVPETLSEASVRKSHWSGFPDRLFLFSTPRTLKCDRKKGIDGSRTLSIARSY
jgi:hypothetical protein